jgi:hypothetical protein
LDPLYDWWKETFRIWEDCDWATPLSALWKSLKDRECLQRNAGGCDLSFAATYLRVWSPGAAAEMDHLEADQKFFRGLILVFLFAWLTFVWSWETGKWPWAGLMLLLFPMFPFRVFGKTETKEANEKKELALLQLLALIVILVFWIAWFMATPTSVQFPPATEGLKAESSALSVTASSGGVSLTAKSENKSTADVTWTIVRKHPAGFKAFLLFGLALSLVRFVQQRLKYSKFVYRAYIILTTLKSPPGATDGAQHGHA